MVTLKDLTRLQSSNHIVQKKKKKKKTASLPSTWLKKLSFPWSQLMICRQTPKTEQHKNWKGPSQNPSYINHLVTVCILG